MLLLSFSHPLLCYYSSLSFGSHLRVGRYSNHNEFARDVRRCVGNFLHFNYGTGNSKMRRDVGRVLFNFEDKWKQLKTEVRDEIGRENKVERINRIVRAIETE
jgi:hypothetical protein